MAEKGEVKRRGENISKEESEEERESGRRQWIEDKTNSEDQRKNTISENLQFVGTRTDEVKYDLQLSRLPDVYEMGFTLPMLGSRQADIYKESSALSMLGASEADVYKEGSALPILGSTEADVYKQGFDLPMLGSTEADVYKEGSALPILGSTEADVYKQGFDLPMLGSTEADVYKQGFSLPMLGSTEADVYKGHSAFRMLGSTEAYLRETELKFPNTMNSDVVQNMVVRSSPGISKLGAVYVGNDKDCAYEGTRPLVPHSESQFDFLKYSLTRQSVSPLDASNVVGWTLKKAKPKGSNPIHFNVQKLDFDTHEVKESDFKTSLSGIRSPPSVKFKESLLYKKRSEIEVGDRKCNDFSRSSNERKIPVDDSVLKNSWDKFHEAFDLLKFSITLIDGEK